MKNKKYTYQYFRDQYPEWKRKKDSFIVRNFLRPISFYIACFAANCGFTANDISLLSIFVAFIASILFLFPYKLFHIIGSLLVVFWMILDCTDGNLARAVRKQKYGEFADAVSSYILFNILFLCLGITAYFEGGLFVKTQNIWIVFCASMTGGLDSLSRLSYQKFINTEFFVENTEEVLADQQIGIRAIYRRFTREIGLNGIFLPAIIFCSIWSYLDIFILFYFIISLCTFSGTLLTLLGRVKKESQKENTDEQF